MKSLRTPDERFENLPAYPFRPNYLMVDDAEGGELRMHYLDEGPKDAPVALMLHGEPSWSYLYRKMVPIVAEAGYRVVAPDLIGFGRSDKPTKQGDYTHTRHVQWVGALLDKLDLRNITLVCQDWGGLIGLRLVADHGERFAGVVAANTMLPHFSMSAVSDVIGLKEKLTTAFGFGSWYALSQLHPWWKAGNIVQLGTATKLSDEVRAAYDAPYPSRAHMAGARVFPRLVPSEPVENRAAWEKLRHWEKPFLCAFSDKDPIMSPLAGIFPALIPGARGRSHTTIRGAGHFLQEDKGEELAQVVADFMKGL